MNGHWTKLEKTLISIVVAMMIIFLILIIFFSYKLAEVSLNHFKEKTILQANNWLLRLENKDNDLKICQLENYPISYINQDENLLLKEIFKLSELRDKYKFFFNLNKPLLLNKKYDIWKYNKRYKVDYIYGMEQYED